MKHTRKLLSLILVFLLTFSFSFSANALYESAEQIGKEPQETSNSETILVHYADGHTEQKEFVLEPSRNYANGANAPSLDPYLPKTLPITQQSDTPDISVQSIDPNDRVAVDPPDYRIGYLRSGFDSDGDNEVDMHIYGTASLQNHDILLSSAHCVWRGDFSSFESEGWADTVEFFPGRDGYSSYGTKATAINKAISMTYVNNGKAGIYDTQNDWTIITIDKDLGSQYGWLGLHGCSEVELNYTMETIGYPGDKGSYYQWKSTGIVTAINGYAMDFSAYTYPGNSGGPIMINGYVYGIYGWYYTDTSTNEFLGSGGVRMHDTLMGMIAQARDDSEARWP